MMLVYDLNGKPLWVYYFYDYDESFTFVSYRKISEEDVRASVKEWSIMSDRYMSLDDIGDREYITLNNWLEEKLDMYPLERYLSCPMYIRE